ncbi:MAG TPA: hypothetical protein DD473_13840, partial [Planctomycetaceae bacterium]|nr:hypothetical protein [Planctomycetaceae bacterium]
MIVTCQCGKRYRIKETISRRKLWCRACGAAIQMTTPVKLKKRSKTPSVSVVVSDVESDPSSVPAANLHPIRVSHFLLVSIGWILLGTLICRLAPWLGFVPLPIAMTVSLLPIAVTVVLIGANLVLSLRMFRRSGSAVSSLPLACMQLPLFMLIFFQIACHLGAEHYAWDEQPGVFDWIEFALAHAFRAGDMIDTLEASGTNIQTIHCRSHLVAVTVIAYHLVVDIFLLEILMAWVERVKLKLMRREALRTVVRCAIGISVVAFLVSWLVTALVWQRWETEDLWMWPIQNVLAIVDFTDVMEIYEIRLHNLPMGVWMTTLAITFRILIAIALANLLNRLSRDFHRHWLARFAMSVEAFEDIRSHHPDPEMRQWANQRLLAIRSVSEESISNLEAVGKVVGVIRQRPVWITAVVVIVALFILPSPDGTAMKLTRVVMNPESTHADSALLAIRKMGRYAENSAGWLKGAVRESPFNRELSLERELGIVETMSHLGPKGIIELSKLMKSRRPEIQHAAIRALANAGSGSAPFLIPALASEDMETSETAAQALESIGRGAIEPLIEALNQNSVGYILPVLVKLDPYWYRRPTDNAVYARVIFCWEQMQALNDVEDPSKTIDAMRDLCRLGKYATPGIPRLAQLSTDSRPDIREAARDALSRISPQWHTSRLLHDEIDWFADRVGNSNPSVAIAACEVLGQLGTVAELALPQLVKCVRDESRLPQERSKAVWVIGQTAPETKKIYHGIPGEHIWGAVISLLGNDNMEIRSESLLAVRKADDDMIPLLSVSFEKQNAMGRRNIANLLGDRDVAAKPAAKNLIPGLVDSDNDVRREVQRALDRIAPDWRRHMRTLHLAQDLERLTESPDAEIHEGVLDAINIIGPRSETLKVLVYAQGEPDHFIRSRALSVLRSWRSGEFWAKNAPITMTIALDLFVAAKDESEFRRLRELLELLGGQEWPQRSQVAHYVGKLLAQTQDASRSEIMRAWFVDVIGQMGPSAKTTVPALIELTAEEGRLENAAERALIAMAQPTAPSAELIDPAEWSLRQQEITQQIIEHCKSLLD